MLLVAIHELGVRMLAKFYNGNLTPYFDLFYSNSQHMFKRPDKLSLLFKFPYSFPAKIMHCHKDNGSA